MVVVWCEYTGRALPVSGSVNMCTASLQRGWLSLLRGSTTVYLWTKEGYRWAKVAADHSAFQQEKVCLQATALQYVAD